MKLKKFFISIIFSISIIIACSSLSLASSDIIVALDPGHGGNDPGPMGGKLRESDLTWKIASRVKEILDDIYDYFERLNGPDEDIEYIENKRKELLEE